VDAGDVFSDRPTEGRAVDRVLRGVGSMDTNDVAEAVGARAHELPRDAPAKVTPPTAITTMITVLSKSEGSQLPYSMGVPTAIRPI
jgi:hypothetical protein